MLKVAEFTENFIVEHAEPILGPTDNMDLKTLKKKHGDKLSFPGGYILGSEGDIPVEMSLETLNYSLN